MQDTAAHTTNTARIEFDTALQNLQTVQDAYRQAQQSLYCLHTRRADLQTKIQQFEAAGQAADAEFKTLFAEHDFMATPAVKTALSKKSASQDMVAQVAQALAECQREIDNFPFQPEIQELVASKANAYHQTCKAYAAYLLASALAHLPENLLKAIALHKHLTDTSDYKGVELWSEDEKKEIIARALRPIFQAIEDQADMHGISADLQAVGITKPNHGELPHIPVKTPAQILIFRRANQNHNG